MWKGSKEAKGYRLLKWDVVKTLLRPVDQGLQIFNKNISLFLLPFNDSVRDNGAGTQNQIALSHQIRCSRRYLYSFIEQSLKTDFYHHVLSGHYPKKVRFFIWELNHSCINTFDKLQRRSPCLYISPSCCPMCSLFI